MWGVDAAKSHAREKGDPPAETGEYPRVSCVGVWLDKLACPRKVEILINKYKFMYDEHNQPQEVVVDEGVLANRYAMQSRGHQSDQQSRGHKSDQQSRGHKSD